MNHAERGDATVYMALIISVLIVSSALIFNTILTREIHLSRAVGNSERAFAAADSGFEQALYQLSTTADMATEGQGEITYGGEKATYTFKGQIFLQNNVRVPCILSAGTYRNETRRLFSGPSECSLGS